MRCRWRTSSIALLLALGMPAAAFAQRGFHATYSRDGIDAWAVGDSALTYRSLDGGLSWASSVVGTGTLRDVVARGLTVLMVADSGKIWRSTNSGGSWELRVWPGTPSLRSVAMPNATTAFAVGAGGTILKSEDGGASWAAQASGTSVRLNAVHFADEQYGWAVGEDGTALSTSDGGATWTPATSGTTRELYAVMQRGSQVWLVGAHGTALKSVNAGASFTTQDLNLDAHADVRAVWLQSADSVYLAGGGGFIRRSVNGGGTWTFPVHNLHGQVADFHIAGATAFVVSNRHRFPMSSIDRGTTWRFPLGGALARTWQLRYAAGPVYGNTFAPHPERPATLWCAISGLIYRTDDHGETWEPIGTLPPNTIQVNAFIVSPKDTNVFVAAIGGFNVPKRLIRSDDHGQTWYDTLLHGFGNYGVPVDYDHDHPDTMYFGGDADVLWRSTDGGKNWEPWSSAPFRSPCDLLVVPDSSEILILSDGVTSEGQAQYYKSIDGGRTFALKLTRPPGASEIPEIATSRLRPNVVFGTNWGGGGVQRSADYGETWPTVSTASSAWGVDISRDDPNLVIFGQYNTPMTWLSIDGGTSYSGVGISSLNYSFYVRDRETILAEQLNGIYKMRFHYTYAPLQRRRLVLTGPEGGETWNAGGTQEIAWVDTNVALAVLEVRRAPGEEWLRIAEVPGYRKRYRWTVPNLPGDAVVVRVRDAWGSALVADSSEAFTIVGTTATVGPVAAHEFALRQNRPNPFTGATRITFTLPAEAHVALEVFDLQGHRVATLARGRMPAGEHAVEFRPGAVLASGERAGALRAGVYYCRLTAGARTATRKMLHLP